MLLEHPDRFGRQTRRAQPPELRRELVSLLAQRTGGEFLDQPAIQNDPQMLEDLNLTELAAGASLGLSLRQMRYRMARLGVSVADHVGERE